MMLENAIAAYLEQLTEREFDAPFVSILRRGGYSDIHCLHGGYEFGKDFIAKLEEGDGVHQWAFQTKAGDVDAGDWARLRPQLDELRTSALGHPCLDQSLPRKAALVMTGRLRGKAQLLLQEYNQDCLARRERTVDVWEGGCLIEKILGHGAIPGLLVPSPDFLGLLGHVGNNDVALRDIERYTRSWVGRVDPPERFWSVFLEAGLLAHQLLQQRRGNLSVAVGLGVVRAVEVAMFCSLPQDMLQEGNLLADSIFMAYMTPLLRELVPLFGGPDELFSGHVQSSSAPISHTVRCCLAAEMVGLAGLHAVLNGEWAEADRQAVALEQLLTNNVSSGHPISDRYAVSVMVAACLLFATGRRDVGATYLKAVAKWLCDAYERGYGLAEANASESEELALLLGYAFRHVPVCRRSASYLGTVVLDVLASAGETGTYRDVLNDFLAVGCMCCQNAPSQEDRQFLGEATGTFFQPNIHYDEDPPLAGPWPVAAHHRVKQSGRLSPWGAIAVSCLVRDRHWAQVVRRIMEHPYGAGAH